MKQILGLAAVLWLSGCSLLPQSGSGAGLSSGSESGKASFYADKHQGRKTANGEIYSQQKMTAAHKKLPFGTQVKVTNLNNGKSTVVRINDRGPFVRGRIIDLSKAAFSRLAPLSAGIISVKIDVVD